MPKKWVHEELNNFKDVGAEIGALVAFLPASLVGLLCCVSPTGQCQVLRARGEDEETVSGCLLMVRSVLSSTDSGLSPVTPGPLHITGHNSTHLAV